MRFRFGAAIRKHRDDVLQEQSQLIVGLYELSAEIQSDGIFRWMKAFDRTSGSVVLLQLLSGELSPGEIESLFEYFDKLQATSKSKLFLPDFILSDSDTSFCVVYPSSHFTPLSKADIRQPERFYSWWGDVGEQLFYLHNRDLVHGHVAPENLFIIDGKAHIMNFGFAPLIENGNERALDVVRDACAPEVIRKKIVTPAADVYAFARSVAAMHPELKTTAWFESATTPNPAYRPKRMRNVFDDLSKIWQEVNVAVSKSPVVVPKYTLAADIQPRDGGVVKGAGNYMENATAILIAEPAYGYRFDRWGGDASGDKNVVTVMMDGNKSITAVFVPVRDEAGETPDAERLHRFDQRIRKLETQVGEIIAQLEKMTRSENTADASSKSSPKVDDRYQHLLELKTGLLEGGTLDGEKIEILKGAIFGAETDGTPQTINRLIGDFLFDLNQSKSIDTDHPEWTAFFVETLTGYVLSGANEFKEITPTKENWLIGHIGGKLDDNKRALLKSIKEKADNLPAKLKTKIDFWNI